MDNAVKYSRPGGTVEISLTTHLNQAKLVITDQGIGISPEDQKRIFDRFYRTDDARAHTKKGTGLGLAICAWIVDSHHGRIEVQSGPNKGSSLYGTPCRSHLHPFLKTFNNPPNRSLIPACYRPLYGFSDRRAACFTSSISNPSNGRTYE